MNNKIILKSANILDIKKEIQIVGFDSLYLDVAQNKYKHMTFKIFSLKPVEANILKQLCLSLGFDCAVSRETISCNCEYTDCIISATVAQYNLLIKKLLIQPFRLKELANILKNTLDYTPSKIDLKNKHLEWDKPLMMGIVNVTPDSFSDGGNISNKEESIEKSLQLIADGADIIDIGGESTRPGATDVSPIKESDRVIPIIEAIRKVNKTIPISIDTRNYITAMKAINAGADIINDVSALRNDSRLLSYVCENNIPTIIMHATKVPAELDPKDFQGDIVEDIYKFFAKRIEELTEKGLEQRHIIIDPGIGFGKSVKDSFEIIKRVNEFKSLNCPILMGISRKSFMKKEFNITNTEALDSLSALYGMQMLNKGTHILRVHNVKMHTEQYKYISKVI